MRGRRLCVGTWCSRPAKEQVSLSPVCARYMVPGKET